jgi:spore germination protein GerM
MTRRRAATIGGLAIVALIVGALMYWRLPGWTSRATSRATTRASAAPSPTAPAPPGRKIKARLFYVAEDGMRLTSVERDIAYGEGTVEQAREIVTAQIAPVVEPLVSAVPPGTVLRAVFLTEGGDAYVDLSREVMAAHPGGTHNELLTVYTIVNALTTNLPAVTAVQLLVDGKEVETLSGHIDLRQPLARNLNWVQ